MSPDNLRTEDLEIRATLRLARCLINTPEKWCKGAFKNEHGQMCAAGACLEAADQLGFEDAWQAIGRLAEHISGTLIGYNDLHTHEEVLELFNKAIKEIDNENNGSVGDVNINELHNTGGERPTTE